MAMHADSPAAMVDLGSGIGQSVASETTIALCGDLGAGKTHFVKGIVAGLGCAAPVTSPTFALVHEYHGGRLEVAHFDFYRVEQAQELIELGWDDYVETGGIVVVEWADRFPELMPDGTRWFRFEIKENGEREVLEVTALMDE